MSFISDTFFGGAEKKAGRAQEKRALEGVEEQRRQFDITQQQLQPFVSTGVDALNQQRILLGLGALPAAQPQQQPQQPAQVLGGGSGVGLFGLINKAFDRQQGEGGQLGPTALEGEFIPAGQLTPEEQQQQAFAAFGESPGQRFLRERGQRALLRNASAIGGLGGGNVRSALQQQGIGFAQQDFQNQLNRLAGLSGTGQQTGVNVGQLGAQAASGIAGGLQAAGLGRATGILGQAEQRREGIGQVAQIAGFFAGSDRRLKKNVSKTGELESGLNWYTWDWTEEAKGIVGDQAGEGVIAQEAQEKFPEAISMVKGFLHVDYRRIH